MLTQHLIDALATCESIALQPAPADNLVLIDRDWMDACQTVSNILVSMGLVQESCRWQTMALDPSPNIATVYAHSGRVYISCEDWQQAIYFCKRTLELQPDNTNMYCRLARLYNHVGDYKAESQPIHALLQQQPEQATADGHYQLATVMEQHGLLDQAMECYQSAIATDATFLTAYYALGELFSTRGEQAKTIELLQSLTQQLPEEAMVHYRLGRAYRQGGDLEAALSSFRAALKLDSELHWAYMGMLNVLLQLEQWAEVVEVCRGVLHFEGELPWAYCFMGNALAQQGNIAEARTCHQQAFVLRGWEQCAERGYEFGHTWFSESISLWERHLLPLNAPVAPRPPLRALSLGSGDGSRVCWLMDTLLRSPTDRLLCITADMSQHFQQNIARLSEPDKLVLRTADPLAQLEAFNSQGDRQSDKRSDEAADTKPAQFDIIYLQSHLKTSAYLKALATQAWPLLQPGGVMIFKDYQWQNPEQPEQASKIGIDDFLESVAVQASVLHRSHQVIVSKKGEQDA